MLASQTDAADIIAKAVINHVSEDLMAELGCTLIGLLIELNGKKI